MILLHRISSFGVALVALLSFTALLMGSSHPLLVVFVCGILTSLLMARLLGFQVRTFQFWHLLGTPLLFLLSSFGLFFLLESISVKMLLSGLVTILLLFFVEHVFNFIHLPTKYQPFTLEYLSQLFHVLSVFFLATLGFGLRLFLHTPLWLLSLAFFLVLMFIMYGTLWAGKVDALKARPYAFATALLITELFAVISFLPTGFYTNAAFLALGVYVLLGLSRADALHKLSQEVLRRYVAVFALNLHGLDFFCLLHMRH
ncbi:hypothetical protein HZA87_01110 [Candidatus Uhrbacteria bacterium]|nr:hypothetical protein [Candidatus Uhrbacteria bacterium]